MAGKKSESTTTQPSPRHVLVTTQHRGVFFGELVGDPTKERVTLNGARSVFYWTAESRGFLGLASDGPKPGCKIGKPAGDGSIVYDITGVWVCTPEAVERFKAAAWA